MTPEWSLRDAGLRTLAAPMSLPPVLPGPGFVDPATADIPIIALTAHALATDRAKAEEVGCDGYLAKPCEPRRVVAEVERFLGAGKDGSA